MNYDELIMQQLEATPKPRRKYPLIFISLLLSATLQLSTIYAADQFLGGKRHIDIEPVTTIAVQNRSLKLSPTPSSPTMLTISPDRTRLALVDDRNLNIYNLKDGQLVLSTPLKYNSTPAALQWLPDRNRLIYALVKPQQSQTTIETKIPIKNTGVKDETYSTETYRTETQVLTKDGFEVKVYSLDGEREAQPELIQELLQEGKAPEQIRLHFSTYTNLLFLNWQQGTQEFLTQVDIMKRTKDIRLPRGHINRLLVTPHDGELWAEFSNNKEVTIYKYEKGRWKAPQELDGYRLIGVTPDDSLAVAPDQGGLIGQVLLTDLKSDFKPGWAFSTPIELDKVTVLNDGRLIYQQANRLIVHTPQLGKGIIYNTNRVDCYSSDGKMVVAWEDNLLNIYEEVTQTKTQSKE